MDNAEKTLISRSSGFAERIRATIERLGLSEKQASDYFGVPVPTLRKWCNAEREPSAATHRLIEILGMIEALAPAIHQSLLPRGKK
jgi:DNA-binding transcriptional regulator YiaG